MLCLRFFVGAGAAHSRVCVKGGRPQNGGHLERRRPNGTAWMARPEGCGIGFPAAYSLMPEAGRQLSGPCGGCFFLGVPFSRWF